MKADVLEVMSGMYRANGVQVFLLHPDDLQNTSIDYGFRSKLFPGYDYSKAMIQLQRLIAPGTLFHFQDDLGTNYAFFCFPDGEDGSGPPLYLIIGPVLFHPVSSGEFERLLSEKKIPLELEGDVLEFLNRIPLVMSFDVWNNTILYFLSQIYHGPLEYRLVQYGQFELFQASYADYQIPVSLDVAENTIEERYSWEEKMLNAVSMGNLEQASKAHCQFLHYKLLPRVPDPLRDKKNLTIVLNTLLRKAAQNGSVHPLHIDNLSRQFAIQIESASSVNQLNALSSNMVRKYCLLVKNYSRNAYSSLVQTCMNYIDFHYVDDLSLNRMADMCSVSGSYLSALFKKEVGMTMTDYINQTRIRQALVLLNTTSLSVQEIASRCGFSDSNYFTRTFKKFQGISPKGYRESISR